MTRKFVLHTRKEVDATDFAGRAERGAVRRGHGVRRADAGGGRGRHRQDARADVPARVARPRRRGPLAHPPGHLHQPRRARDGPPRRAPRRAGRRRTSGPARSTTSPTASCAATVRSLASRPNSPSSTARTPPGCSSPACPNPACRIEKKRFPQKKVLMEISSFVQNTLQPLDEVLARRYPMFADQGEEIQARPRSLRGAEARAPVPRLRRPPARLAASS